MVLNGFLKLSVVETRMKMEPGGVEKQALRLSKKDDNKIFSCIIDGLVCLFVVTPWERVQGLL